MMNEATQIGISVVSSGVLLAVVNGLLGRRKVSAEATEIIAKAAGTLTGFMSTQLLELQRRMDERDLEDYARDRLLNVHMRWDQEIVDELRKAMPERDFGSPPPLKEDLLRRDRNDT